MTMSDLIDRFCEAMDEFYDWWLKNRAPHLRVSAGANPAGSKTKRRDVKYGGSK